MGGKGESGGRGLRRGVGGLVRRVLVDRGCSQALTQRWVQLQEGTSKGPLSLEGSVRSSRGSPGQDPLEQQRSPGQGSACPVLARMFHITAWAQGPSWGRGLGSADGTCAAQPGPETQGGHLLPE